MIHFHEERPHQGLGNRAPNAEDAPAETVADVDSGEIVCHERLAGLLKSYQQKGGVDDR